MVKSLWSRVDRRVVILAVLLIALAGVLNVALSPARMNTVTAHFSRAVSVYPGTDVRILGVNVGKVTAVIPQGDSVRVEMEYDAKYRVPADAKAAIVTPTLVADRFVQLTPVYVKGAVMADGADIPLAKTVVPVELDRIYGSLKTLTQALGPNGVNKDGTLNHLLKAAHNSLGGEGASGRRMIQELSRAAQVFGDNAGPLFQTVSQLARFTQTLGNNDKLVRAFMKDLAGISRTLAGESGSLQKTIAAVAQAVGSVKGFVHDNRDALVHQISNLKVVMHTIASERSNLDTVLRIAPVAMGNLQAGFDHSSGSQNSRITIAGYAWDADGFICAIIMQKQGMPASLKKTACDLISQLMEPILTKVPYFPPNYSQFTPTSGRKGSINPKVTPVYNGKVAEPSMSALFGGES
ncbi:MAG TPA: MCE family protein [Nocardioides sp.]|nr:MCE family protein [Nocardioides sp.]